VHNAIFWILFEVPLQTALVLNLVEAAYLLARLVLARDSTQGS
jgi:hypothetical protein